MPRLNLKACQGPRCLSSPTVYIPAQPQYIEIAHSSHSDQHAASIRNVAGSSRSSLSSSACLRTSGTKCHTCATGRQPAATACVQLAIGFTASAMELASNFICQISYRHLCLLPAVHRQPEKKSCQKELARLMLPEETPLRQHQPQPVKLRKAPNVVQLTEVV